MTSRKGRPSVKYRILLALLPTLVVMGLLTAPAAEALPPGETGIVDCNGAVITKPKQITIACADSGVALTGIRWKSWSANAAKGTGTLAWNTCLPQTCAAGIVQKYRVKITLGGLASAPGQSDIFSQVTVVFTKGGPAGLVSGTYTLDNPPS
jgi:hypothetical protein